MSARTSFVWIAIVCGACSKADDKAGPAAPGSSAAGSAAPGSAAQAPAVAPPTPPPPAPAKPAAPPLVTCTRGEFLERYERAGDAAIACFTAKDDQRDCWRIDRTGAATPLPQDQWPAKGVEREQGDRTEPKDLDGVSVLVPAPLQVNLPPVDGDYDTPPIIEVCSGAACKRVQLRKEKEISLQGLQSVTVLADGKTLYAGLGIGTTGDQAIDRYDLDRPKAPPQRLKVGGCGRIFDVLAGNLLVQTSGCVNAGGDRVVMTPQGKLLGNLGEFGFESPYFALGGDRWLFVGYDRFAIWDLAKGKRIVAVKDGPHAERRLLVISGAIIALRSDGTITGYDEGLRTKPLGAIPRCPAASPATP